MTDYSNDIICSIIEMVLEVAPAVPLDVIKRIDRQIRAEWGGRRPYISKKRHAHGVNRRERNDRLRD